MANFPYQYVNINGIPTIETRSVTVSDTAVNFGFRPDFTSRPFRGLLLVYVSETAPDGTTTTLPVTFTMAGNTMNLTQTGGTNVTLADLPVGVYLVYYDRYANVLQLI
jgi:hypothetical protein